MTWLAVAIGGAIGACGRYALALVFPVQAGVFPLATYIANGLGCFLIGFSFLVVVEKAMFGDYAKHLVIVGFLGALTTYSSFALEAVNLIQRADYKLVSIYVLATLVTCIAATAFGLVVAKTILN